MARKRCEGPRCRLLEFRLTQSPLDLQETDAEGTHARAKSAVTRMVIRTLRQPGAQVSDDPAHATSAVTKQ